MMKRPLAGYTLIELMVSMAIFAMVMLTATAAYLSFISYNRQLQTQASEVNTLSSDVDSMAREIRSGSNYKLDLNNDTFDFCFTNQNGSVIEYVRPSAGSAPDIQRIDHGTTGNCFFGVNGGTKSELTDATITITSLVFRLVGASNADALQPTVSIKLAGYACVPNETCTVAAGGRINFYLETSATQRLADFPGS